MELASKPCASLLYWILDHKHFLLFSFFAQSELEDTLAYVSRRFNEKVMSILLWREMMNQISEVVPNSSNNETLPVTEDRDDNSDIEREKIESLMQSCEIIDREAEKEMQEQVIAESSSFYTTRLSNKSLELEQELSSGGTPKGNIRARKKFLKEYSLPGEYQWIDLSKVPRILMLSPEIGSAYALKEMKDWIERIKVSFAKIQSNTPESVML